jgi:hypothetical protein
MIETKKTFLCIFISMSLVTCSTREHSSHEILNPEPGSENGDNRINRCKSVPIPPPKGLLDENSKPEDTGEPTKFGKNKLFYGAEIVSKKTFTYGKFVARMKPAHVRGTVSAFFLFSAGSNEEFDVEILGGGEMIVPVIHPCGVFKEIKLNPTLLDTFHDYSIEWTPHSVRWLIDGIIFFQIQVEGYGIPKHIILSSNVALSWDGAIDLSEWEEHKISYQSIRYYPYFENECAFSSTSSWEDDFIDDIDDKWSKTTTGTGPFSLSIFNKANVRQTTVDGVGQLDLWLTKIL